ncbi:hypothetical protein TNCV_4101831 [Trichonephila clavipes]|nr:hypothetical protein TNCV_4101831 [Trichonephila clavipes]
MGIWLPAWLYLGNRAKLVSFLVTNLETLEVLPELFTDVLAPLRGRMWLQKDGAPSHYGRCVHDHLDQAFPKRWIGRGSPIVWPPRSSDLSPL